MDKTIRKIKAWLKKTWLKIKNWSGWSKAGSIFMARMAAIAGMITSIVGAMDWSPLWNLFTTGTDFTQKQLIFMGIGIIGGAITAELVRSHGTKDF